MRESEHREQVSLFEWWHLSQARKPWVGLLFAIPNGGKRDYVTAAKLKAEGVRAGVPDMFLAWPVGGYAGLWIELKTARGRATEKQKEMLEQLRGAGYAAVVAHGWIRASEIIERYLEGGEIEGE